LPERWPVYLEVSVGDADRASAGQPVDAANLYRLLVESVRDYAIFALDPTGHIVSWNEGAERIKGYSLPTGTRDSSPW
jgi:PAS domain-containing protein